MNSTKGDAIAETIQPKLDGRSVSAGTLNTNYSSLHMTSQPQQWQQTVVLSASPPPAHQHEDFPSENEESFLNLWPQQ